MSSTRRKRFWLVGFAGLVLISAGLAGGWALGWFPPRTEPKPTIPALNWPRPISANQSTPEPAPVNPEIAKVLTGSAPKALGRRVHVLVLDPAADEVLLQRGAARALPASTVKLLTSAAALAELGAETTFSTETRLAGNTLTLVGGGDPYLSSSTRRSTRIDRALPPPPPSGSLAQLAEQTATQLLERGQRKVTLAYDLSLFSGPGRAPSWPQSYLTENVVAPIGSLWVDRGRAKDGFAVVPDPPGVAAEEFAKHLKRYGVQVRGPIKPRPAAPDAEPLASVESATVLEIVRHLLEVSDNEAAEVLGRHLARSLGLTPDFPGTVAAIEQVLTDQGVSWGRSELADASGLSRENQVELAGLAQVLSQASQGAVWSPMLADLPIAGATGSLTDRFPGAAGDGWVRAKTGTLSGVSALAGLVDRPDGSRLVVVVIADAVPITQTVAARAAMDRWVTRLVTAG